MSKKKLIVDGLPVAIESVGESDFISLTDIAKRSETSRPDVLILSWMKNASTLEFLETWEQIHNPDFNSIHLDGFKIKYLQNRHVLSPKTWIDEVGAVGLISKSGRHGGGTWAHADIALNFCYWLSPRFQVFFIKEFQRLKREEYDRRSLEWHVERVTDLLDEARNWMDSMPGQKAQRNRLKSPE